jgi:crotonobetainyl-CoA:carnitine CoA-transferase CaiB-like acyl-CoA transferase
LMIAAEHLPQVDEHVMDTSHGKRSCFLDLKTTEGVAQLKDLVRSADVFSQGYRPGMLENLGFGPEQLAELRPGIISLSISCFGADGPFSHRAGWEQVGQTVTGICQEGSPERPKLLPAAACDYTTGYLGAYGALVALNKRAREGGSYLVRVSLCQSGMFIYRQGKTAPVEEGLKLSEAELNALRIDTDPASGPLRHLGPVLKLSETQPHWSRPTPVLGGDAASWLS